MLDWKKASDEQLKVIVDYERDCPKYLIRRAFKELLERNAIKVKPSDDPVYQKTISDYRVATNRQLIVAIAYDKHCPKTLVHAVVLELIKRDALKHIILKNATYFFGQIRDGELKLGLEKTDILQLAYIGMLKALDKYEEGRSTFFSFATLYMHTEWKNYIRKFNAEKRTGDREGISFEVPIGDSNVTIGELIPSEMNVEKKVLMKVHFETELNKLTELQKEALIGYIQGYELREIAEKLNKKRQSVERAFHRAIEKIGGEKLDLRSISSGVKSS